MNALEAASLVMIPSGYEDGTLGSLKPLDGSGDFTFSRGSNISATRVNADGYIEKGRENLLLHSNDFSQSVWLKLNGASVVGKTATDPFGVANNAWVVTFDGTSNARIEQSMGNMLKTSSLYARTQSGTQDVQIGNKTSGIPTFTLTTEWQRIEAFSSAGGNPRLRCDDAVILEIFGFQSEQSLAATPYIESGTTTGKAGILEDMPRVDFSGGNQSLLLEPSRTNLASHSEYLSSISGVTLSNVSLSYTATTSPENVGNANKLVVSNIVDSPTRLFVQTQGSGSQVVSVFAKAGEVNSIAVSSYTGTAYLWAAYNLTNGSLISATTDDYGIQDYGNGWYRVWVYVANSTNRYAQISIGD